MKVEGINYYTGALAKRQQETQISEKNISEERLAEIGKAIQSEFNSLGGNRDGVKVSVSQDTLDFLCSSDGLAKMKQDAEDIYVANLRQQQRLAEDRDPSDKFWNNTGDQWLTFSETLYNSGFYDNMSDEQVMEFENLLERITSGMDNLSKSQFNTGIDFGQEQSTGKFFMTSAEAVTSLESSVAALQYLSDKLLPNDLKDEFNGMIDMYKKHNEEIMSEYKSPMESFDRVVADIYKTGRGHMASKPVEEYMYYVKLGEIEADEEKDNGYRTTISDIFKKYMMAGKSDIAMGMLKNQFEQYVTDNSDDQGLRQYVSREAEDVFANIQDYWKVLINRQS